MSFFANVWMPILLSAVLVWIASFLTHMVLPHHKSEFGGLPDEEKFSSEIAGVSPGLYMFPYCSHTDMKNPEAMERMKKGPNGVMVIWPGMVNMGQNLILTLLFYAVAGAFVAYLGKFSGFESAEYMHRFKFFAIAAFAIHGLGWIPFFIWFKFGKFWPNFFDSIVYALVTAGTFAWLWPKA